MMSKPFKPHEYQKTAIKFLLEHDHAALFLDPGLGKTAITLSAYQKLRKAGKVGPALCICPLRVADNVWTNKDGGELAKWDDFSDLRAVFLHGSKKEAFLEARNVDLYVVNYDGLLWLLSRTRLSTGAFLPAPIEKLFAKGVHTLIFDELSKMKNWSSKRFKATKPYLARFMRRWGLTGSPAPNGLLDLFGEVYCIDGGKALGPYITSYRLKYFNSGGFKGYEWTPRPDSAELIYRQLEDVALSMRAVDHLPGMPELIEENLWCDIPDKSRKLYDELEEDLIGELDGETITAGSAAIVSGKLRQIASGGLYVHKPAGPLPLELEANGKIHVIHGMRETRFVHDAKTDALVDLVEELQGQPLLVGYWFEHDLDRMREAIGPSTPTINGDTTERQCTEILKRWNEGKIPVLFGHPQSMGHGLNMQHGVCAHVCFYSVPWDYDLYSQCIARVWRQGNAAKHVIVSRLLARKTIDEAVARAIGNKALTQDGLFQALKAYVKGKGK